jgi:hypothetical protein
LDRLHVFTPDRRLAEELPGNASHFRHRSGVLLGSGRFRKCQPVTNSLRCISSSANPLYSVSFKDTASPVNGTDSCCYLADRTRFDASDLFNLIFLVSLGGVRLSPLRTSATVSLLYQPRMIDDYGAVGGMRIGRGNRSARRKPAPVPLCPPQIPHDLTWDRTRVAAVGSQRLTA